MADIATKEVVHGSPVKTLCLRDGTVLMSEQQGLQIHYFLAKLSDGSRESIILCTEQLNLCLKVGKPLLLSLATLERSNPTL